MLNEILVLLLEFGTGLLGGACLLRAYMRGVGVSMDHPPGRFILAVTDWLVLPLRRGLRPSGRWDLASLLAAWLVMFAQFALLWALHGGGASWAAVVVLAFFGLAQMAISIASAVVLVAAILSWVQPGGPMAWLLERLTSPLLAPLRRVIPLVGGVDLSPLALLVLLQIAAIVLANLQHLVLGFGAWLR